MRRRTYLAAGALVPILSIGGYRALDSDERRIHRPVRQWEPDTTLEFYAARGETLVVEIDTRRTTPGLTRVQVVDPTETSIGTAELRDATPRATFPVERTGEHLIRLEPYEPNGRARVWIDITVENSG